MEEKKKKKSQEELEELQRKQEQDLERAAILMKADEIKEETFDFDVNGQIELKNELADMVLEQIDDPEAKYNLYYNDIHGEVYEEYHKNVFIYIIVLLSLRFPLDWKGCYHSLSKY